MADQKFANTAAIVTVSDKGSRGEREDTSGKQLREALTTSGYDVISQSLVPDEIDAIARELCRLSDEHRVALIVTTGGTGVSPRDVTPEATLKVVDRVVPGMAEVMRAKSLEKTVHAMISRAVVGIRAATLIVNLPGSPRGAMENLAAIMPALHHALEKIQGDPSECAQQP